MKKIAVMGMSRDESLFAPIWYKHYSKMVGEADVYVIDDNTIDDSLSMVRNVIPVTDSVNSKNSGTQKYNKWRIDTIKKYRTLLLQDYEWIIHVDMDELVFHNNMDIFEYVSTTSYSTIKAYGFDIVQQTTENPLDPKINILDQRKYCRKLDEKTHKSYYQKPVLSKVNIDCFPGHHNCKNQSDLDPNLIMIHIRYADKNHWEYRNNRRYATDRFYYGGWKPNFTNGNKNTTWEKISKNLQKIPNTINPIV